MTCTAMTASAAQITWQYLGEGSYSTVHLARSQQSQRIVVVKEAKPKGVVSLYLERFILQNYPHDNIVQYLGFSHEVMILQPVLILEYCGCDLQRTFLGKESQRITLEEVDSLSCQLFKVLSFLHSEGIAHRDLTSTNVFFDRGSKRLKIADFGMAWKVKPSDNQDFKITTFTYRAPEVILQCPYGKEVDVWSAGIIICELLLKEHPFFWQNIQRGGLNEFSKEARGDLLRYVARLIDEEIPQSLWNSHLIDHRGKIVGWPLPGLKMAIRGRQLPGTLQVRHAHWPAAEVEKYMGLLKLIFKWDKRASAQTLLERL